MPILLDDLRRFAVARSLFHPTTLKRALHRMGFVQADPIRAPARAQDLILRHRVKNYCAGDLERGYAKLGVEEDFFINYGFVTREVQALMHPRLADLAPVGLLCDKLLHETRRPVGVPNSTSRLPWPAARRKRAQLLLEFVRERGIVHPQEVDQHFSHGTVKNYWGGKSNATTHLLDEMHYEGLLRVMRRQAGIRLYSAQQHGPGPADEEARCMRMDALVDVAVGIYTPMTARGLTSVIGRLRYAVPQWQREIKRALERAKQRLAHERVDSVEWYWPAGENPMRSIVPEMSRLETVRLLAPFDPVVWDRARFELLWGWVYRFEAYTPPAKRVRGYYALPLLWRDRVIGWGNLSVENGALRAELGFVESKVAKDSAFRRALDEELERVKNFLGLGTQ
jgi:uncharacterized protein